MSDAQPASDDVTLLVSPTKQTVACRFCGSSALPDAMLVPCACQQPSPFVHRACLDNWRAFNLDGRSFLHCNACHTAYRFLPYTDTPERALERTYAWQSRTGLFLSVAACVFLASVQFLAVFINACDINSSIPPHFPSVSPLMCYFLLALLALLCLVNVVGVVAYTYGLHLPIAQRDNYAVRGGREYFHPTHRQDFAFVCHPDLFCYGPLGLQREYAALPSTHSPALDALLLAGIVAVTWLLGLFMGCVVTAYIAWRTGGRYIEKLRLEGLCSKYQVADIREARAEEGLLSDSAGKVSWQGGAEEKRAASSDSVVADVHEAMGVLPTQPLASFIADSADDSTKVEEAKEAEQSTADTTASVSVGEVQLGVESDSDDELVSNGAFDKWRWQEAASEDEQDELDDDGEVEESSLDDFVAADHASLDEWLGGSGEASAEQQHDSEEEKVQVHDELITAMP